MIDNSRIELEQVNKEIQMVRSALSNAEGFRHWLLSKPIKTIIGTTGKCSTCPIAMYMTESLDIHVPEVAAHGIQKKTPCTVYFSNEIDSSLPEVPCWIDIFINRIDDQGEGIKVTAADALDILDEMANTFDFSDDSTN